MTGDHSFQRYLHAKSTVDDRALDRRVLTRLDRDLDRRRRDADGPLRVLEAGAGVGTMVTRLLDRDVLPSRVHYTAVDDCRPTVEAAREHLLDWAAARDDATVVDGDGSLRLESAGRTAVVDLVCGDAFAVAACGQWDLLVAAAFLDLVDLPSALSRLFDGLTPGGLWYFPITFDGGTILEPPVDPDLDERIVDLYHRSMDERTRDGEPAGDSRTGRRLFTEVPDAGGTVTAAGGSDWVVYPREDGYPADEAYVLHHVVETIDRELAGHPQLDGAFDRWVDRRHEQIEAGRLVYVAHQLDLLGRVP